MTTSPSDGGPAMHPQSMRRRRRWILIGLAALILAVGVGMAATYLRSASQRATATAIPIEAAVASQADAMRARPAAEQLALAQAAAFGTTGPAQVEAMTYAPGEMLWLGDTAVLLSPGTNAEDCHACAGGVAITYLRPERGRFRVAGQWTDAIGGNGFGQPPTEWGVRRDLAATPVVVAETGFSNQGYSCGIATMTALTPAGPLASPPVPIAYSNEGAIDEATGRTMGGEARRVLDGTIADVRPGEGFTVRAEGVADRYVLRAGRFVIEGGASPLACD